MLASWGWSPRLLDFSKPLFAANMVVDRDLRVNVGVGTKTGSIPSDDAFAQVVGGSRYLDGVAGRFQGDQRALQRFKQGEISRSARVAGVGREIEDDDPELAIRPVVRRSWTSLATRRASMLARSA